MEQKAPYPTDQPQFGAPYPPQGMPMAQGGSSAYPPQSGMPMAPPTYNYSNQSQQFPITQQPTMTTVIVQQASFGPDPQPLQCPMCKSNITSTVKSEPATKTHLIALVICLVGCWGGCCLIPYCVDSCQSQVHTCPACGNFLGKHN